MNRNTLVWIGIVSLGLAGSLQALPIVDGQKTAGDGYTHTKPVKLTDGPGGTEHFGSLSLFQSTPTSDLFVVYESAAPISRPHLVA